MTKNSLDSTTFILGVGAQKTGTSWLHAHLAKSDQVSVCPIKELHAFDAWYRPDLCGRFDKYFLNQLSKRIEKRLEIDSFRDDLRLQCLLLRAQLIYDKAAYIELLKTIKSKSATHVCEITPSYSLIDGDGFKEIKSLLDGAGLSTKLVFLMRDPIERYFSALRMRERDTQGKFSAIKNFTALMGKKRDFERGAYDATIKSVLSAFDREDVYFGFYERLFRPETINEIEDFLGVAHIEPDFGKVVNASPNEDKLSDDDIALGLKAFAPVYDYCREFFGDKIPEEWHQ